MDFPHINDTQFPHIDNVDVYKYQNNFDYMRWQGKVTFKLINVLWNSNYADVPYFETVKDRNAWFDSKEGYVGTLETLFNNTPENTVKIPIPYNDAYKYNYLIVEMPMQTSETNPINYEDKDIRINRWFYFIEDMVQFAPSTTELTISVDYWTTFINSVEIPYLMLERGHAPMMQTTPEEFLANPIKNNEYLLADDFNYGTDSVIQTSNYLPIGNGKKYVLWCMPFNKDDFDILGGGKYSGNSTPPTYANTSERWGYQIDVNGYQWKYGDSDYSDANLPIYNAVQSGVLNGCECFAIEAIYAPEFFNEMAKYHVNFIHAIQAMFILDESLFQAHRSFGYNGYTIYIADKKLNTFDINLTKDQFGFDNRYKEITKLYTSPYSYLEVTDDEGSSFTAKVENCGNLQAHTEVSLIYPFLNYNVFMSGINGDGTMKYTWKGVYDVEENKTMWASDFSKFMFSWNVPVYSIYVSAEDEYAANNFAGMQARRAGAIKDYENSVRFGNTTRENTADSMATNTVNVNATTTTNVANMARNSAGILANANDTADTNEYIVDTLQYGGTYDGTTPTGGTGGFQSRSTGLNIWAVETENGIDRTYLKNQAGNDIDYSQAVATNNSGAAIAAGYNNGFASFASSSSGGKPTDLLSGTVGFISNVNNGAISSTNTIMNNIAFISKTEQGVGINLGYFTDKFATFLTKTGNAYNIAKEYSEDLVETQNDLFIGNTERFSAPTGINNTNESANKATNDANALRTQNTETNNATQTRNANVVAEKANLVQKQFEAEAQYRNARLQKPAQYSSYSGDFGPDAYQRRGIRINVRTQSKSAIAQAGDAMLRFGYALHRIWNMENGFHYGKFFTFWKAEDIWINDGSGVANAATNAIGNILMKGVTVWRNPDQIGTIGIYDNI